MPGTEGGSGSSDDVVPTVGLADLVGQLGRSLTLARAESDQATVDVARSYASDSLLRHLSVARMRLGSVVFTVPVALSGASRTAPSSRYGPFDNTALARIVYRLLLKAMGRRSLPRDESRSMMSVVRRHTEALDLALGAGADVDRAVATFISRMIDDFGRETARAVSTPVRVGLAALEERADELRAEVIRQLPTASLDQSDDAGIGLIVDARRLVDLPPAAIGSVRIEFTETGVQLAATDDGSGTPSTMLIPE